MGKLNTVQNGKGDKPRVSDWKKYYNSPLWENIEKNKSQSAATDNTTTKPRRVT